MHLEPASCIFKVHGSEIVHLQMQCFRQHIRPVDIFKGGRSEGGIRLKFIGKERHLRGRALLPPNGNNFAFVMLAQHNIGCAVAIKIVAEHMQVFLFTGVEFIV